MWELSGDDIYIYIYIAIPLVHIFIDIGLKVDAKVNICDVLTHVFDKNILAFKVINTVYFR